MMKRSAQQEGIMIVGICTCSIGALTCIKQILRDLKKERQK